MGLEFWICRWSSKSINKVQILYGKKTKQKKHLLDALQHELKDSSTSSQGIKITIQSLDIFNSAFI